MRRFGIRTIGLALLLSACAAGAVTGGAPESTATTEPMPVSTRPSGTNDNTTTIALPATSVTAAPITTTTTTAAPTTTSSPASPTTTQPSEIALVSYFFVDEIGHPDRNGPFLVPVSKMVPITKGVARAAIEQLLAGPTPANRDGVPSITSLIPDGVRLLGLDVSEGIATVDLSGNFEADDDAAVAAQRIAQVVYTLARFPSVQEVLFRQDGSDIAVPIGDGQLVSRPVNIGDYLEFAAALHVEEPAYAGRGGNPLHVSGFGAVFEASFSYALTDDDGLIISEGIAMTNNGMGWGGLDFTIDYTVDREQLGALIVWAHSAENGSQIDVREYPVVLVP